MSARLECQGVAEGRSRWCFQGETVEWVGRFQGRLVWRSGKIDGVDGAAGRPRKMGSWIRVFLSYRRDDTAGRAGRLHDAPASEFGSRNVFMDVAAIAVGTDFADQVERAISTADVSLVVIGLDWLGATDAKVVSVSTIPKTMSGPRCGPRWSRPTRWCRCWSVKHPCPPRINCLTI